MGLMAAEVTIPFHNLTGNSYTNGSPQAYKRFQAYQKDGLGHCDDRTGLFDDGHGISREPTDCFFCLANGSSHHKRTGQSSHNDQDTTGINDQDTTGTNDQDTTGTNDQDTTGINDQDTTRTNTNDTNTHSTSVDNHKCAWWNIQSVREWPQQDIHTSTTIVTFTNTNSKQSFSVCKDTPRFFGEITSNNVKPDGPVGAPFSVDVGLECARRCFHTATCQWFSLTTETKMCMLFTGMTSGEPDPDTAVGFLHAASPDDLNRKVPCTEQPVDILSDGAIPNLPIIRVCQTTAGTSVVSDATNQCGAGPWTLYRGYLAGGKLADYRGVTNYKEFETAMEPEEKSDAIIRNPSSELKIASTRKCGEKTEWKFKYDEHGRVVSVESKMTKRNSALKNYREGGFQSQFNKVHHLTDTSKEKDMVFQAGHVIANQFMNPNSFWNFVPQSTRSNGSPGCWWNAEMQISLLLELGCEGDFTVDLEYFGFDDLPSIYDKAKGKVATHKAESLLDACPMQTEVTDTNTGGGDNNESGALDETCNKDDNGEADTPTSSSVITNAPKMVTKMVKREIKEVHQGKTSEGFVSYPCNYFYRPFMMNLKFKITGCTGTRCGRAYDAIKQKDGKILSVTDNNEVKISRALLRWSNHGGESNLRTLMGFGTNQGGVCLTEFGGMFTKLVLENWFTNAFLVHQQTNTCLSYDSNKVLVFAKCDPANQAQLWTGDEAGALYHANAGSDKPVGKITYIHDTIPFDKDGSSNALKDYVQATVEIGGSVQSVGDKYPQDPTTLWVSYVVYQSKQIT